MASSCTIWRNSSRDEFIVGGVYEEAATISTGPERAHGRRSGRRAGTSGTREAILAAARRHFAQHGYDRASLRAIAAEAARPPDPYSADLLRHLVSTVLLWIERWYDAVRTERRERDDAEVQLHRRFAALLERDFRAHHDAGHYADALGVPPTALARALSDVTGRSTKELVTDRVMLEAARLLRFTDATVGEVAHAVGFADPLYFSRAFKRSAGEAPMAYRGRGRGRSGPGKSMDP
jgi:AraC family transcriptional activator of pobA